MKTLMIGLGRMGERHLQNALRCEELTISALFDVSLERLENLKEAYKLHEGTALITDKQQLLSLGDIELVIIATNADTHLDYVELVCQVNSVEKILCEKPMAPSLDDCQKMIALCEQNHIDLSINHQMRFMEQYTKIKELAASKELGGLISATVTSGNFGFAMNGTHYFEAFKFLGDSAIEQVTALLDDDEVPNPRGTHYKDVGGSVTLKNAANQSFHLNSMTHQGHGIVATYFCRNGFIVVNELSGKISYEYREDEFRDLPTTRYGCPSIKKELSIEPADALEPSHAVLKALLDGCNYPSGEDGMHAMAVLIAAHISSENAHTTLLSEARADHKLPIA